MQYHHIVSHLISVMKQCSSVLYSIKSCWCTAFGAQTVVAATTHWLGFGLRGGTSRVHKYYIASHGVTYTHRRSKSMYIVA